MRGMKGMSTCATTKSVYSTILFVWYLFLFTAFIYKQCKNQWRKVFPIISGITMICILSGAFYFCLNGIGNAFLNEWNGYSPTAAVSFILFIIAFNTFHFSSYLFIIVLMRNTFKPTSNPIPPYQFYIFILLGIIMTVCAVSSMIAQHFYKRGSLSQILTAIDGMIYMFGIAMPTYQFSKRLLTVSTTSSSRKIQTNFIRQINKLNVLCLTICSMVLIVVISTICRVWLFHKEWYCIWNWTIYFIAHVLCPFALIISFHVFTTWYDLCCGCFDTFIGNLCSERSYQGRMRYQHAMAMSQESDLDNGTNSDVPLVIDDR